MSDLIKRVESATGPDRELDEAIERATGNYTAFAHYTLGDDDFDEYVPTRYSASIDAAMTLVPEGFVLHNLQETPTIVHEEHTGWEPLPNWQATLLRQDCAGYRNRKKFMQAFEHGDGNTAAIALCAAALKARGL